MSLARFVALFILTVSFAAAPRAAAPAPAGPAPAPSPKPRPSPTARAFRSDELYSLRERRRIAAYLRMRLLELREAGLERAAEAIERRLPADVLLGPAPPRAAQ
jgi:hypothetical protein